MHGTLPLLRLQPLKYILPFFLAKVVTEEGKARSTFVTAWRALQERLRRHAEAKREADCVRMTERSTRGTTGLTAVGGGAAGEERKSIFVLHMPGGAQARGA